MKSGSGEVFNSKILLFGEYSLMLGSMALSIPFGQFSGSFTTHPDWKSDSEGKFSNDHLNKFASWLENMMDGNKSGFTLDVERFKAEVKKGLVFNSNIPKGYGLGSSGALVAAVYSRYGEPLVTGMADASEIIVLKNFLAQMESCFHGKCSGLDPLICYLKQPLLIQSDGMIKMVDLPEWQADKGGAVFLIDSGTSGKTQPLVDHFTGLCSNPQYLEMILSEYTPLVNNCIGAYCQNEPDLLMKKLENLSVMQMAHFAEMIPASVRLIWERGITSGKYILKLCGSGGGGMILGFTRDFASAKEALGNQKITFVHPL